MKAKDINEQIKKLKQKEKYLEAINAFTTELFEAQTIEEIVWSVTQNAISKLGYVDCVIYLYDSEKGVLIQRAAFGPKNPQDREIFQPIEIKPGQGIVGSVFSSGIGEVIADTTKDSRYIEDDDMRHSEITIPLLYKDQPIGVIDSEHPERDFFAEQDFITLTTIAQLVSTKIAQARATETLVNYQANLEHIIKEKTQELEKKNELLVKQNEEKELLIKEIHHRVKNNMQIMASLAHLQMQATNNLGVQKSLRQFSLRINSMAIIHEKLYQNSEMSGITIHSYLEELLYNIIYSFDREQEVTLNLNLDPIPVSLDDAIPLGLLFNELATNSLKHAFEEQENPEIKVTVKEINKQALVDYQDNGVGITSELDESASFGMELVSVLSEQVGHDIEIDNSSGFHFSMKMDI